MFSHEVMRNDRFLAKSRHSIALPTDPESKDLIESAIKIIMAKRINENLKRKSNRLERKMLVKIEEHGRNYDG